MSEKLLLLEKVLGVGHKTNQDYYQFMCPFCSHHKPKLGVSLGTGKWRCWVCEVNGQKVSLLLKKLKVTTDIFQKAKSLFKEATLVKHKEKVETVLTLPKEYIPLWIKDDNDLYYRKAVNYLKSRGVTSDDIFKHRIGYATNGRYRDSIIFPFYDEDGTLVYYTGRSYLPNTLHPFITPIKVDKDKVFDAGLINWSEPIILVESKLDSIIVRRNAVPLNGKQISHALFKKILDENVKVIYLCLDGDAINSIKKYAIWFNQHGILVRYVEFPLDELSTEREGRLVYHDPTSLGYEKVWDYIENAKILTESDSIKYQILHKLL